MPPRLVLLERAGDEHRRSSRFPEDAVRVVAASRTAFFAGRLRFYSYPLPFTTADLEGWLRWAQRAPPGDTWRRFERLTAAGARLAVPLRAKDDLLGHAVCSARSRQSARHVTATAERLLLRQCAEQLTLMIENARLTSRVVEQEKLRRDVALAAEVQRRLLPDASSGPRGAALAALSLPARSVGGDYYDFLDLGDQRIGIALADIAGKGVAAALIMAVVQASLRIVAADGETSLPELAAKMNGFLHRSTGSNSYATFFYAQLDERKPRSCDM